MSKKRKLQALVPVPIADLRFDTALSHGQFTLAIHAPKVPVLLVPADGDDDDDDDPMAGSPVAQARVATADGNEAE